MAWVSEHAVHRYMERVAAVPYEVARARIEAAHRAIDCAARIGCKTVLIDHGGRLVLDGDRVVTVIGRGQHPTRVAHMPPLGGAWPPA
jgi:hypothetical protein